MRQPFPPNTTNLLRVARGLLTVLLTVVLLSACLDDELSREQRAVRKSAEECYSLLQREKYDAFVDRIAYADQMSEDYRTQMTDLIHEHAESLRQAHGGIVSAKVIGDTIMGTQAHVFIQLSFADNTSEEVGLPMVKVEDEWLMQ